MARSPVLVFALSCALVAAACTASSVPDTAEETPSPEVSEQPPSTTTPVPPPSSDAVLVPPPETATARNHVGYEFPPAPTYPEGPTDPDLAASITNLFNGLEVSLNFERVDEIAASGDPRAAWLIVDLMRFIRPGDTLDVLTGSFQELTGTSLSEDPIVQRSQWQSATDHMIAWDIPALDEYQMWKGRLFTIIDDRWTPFFDDTGADIDWRLLSWGGVLIDDRRVGTGTPCARGCIPALDDPVLTSAAEGDWYPDDSIVFGVTIEDEARAYPKNMMEVHEMVNDTLGGRRIGMPYCTLCGSAQAYLTDSVPQGISQPVLRTSGLLSRSNKVMFDLNTYSVFDTFTGRAVSGPLHSEGITLDQVTVVTSTWGEWKRAHPETTIVASDGGIGRTYESDPLGGRDDNGPIFPVGDVDERLPARARVLGLIGSDGGAVAFPVDVARTHLESGGTIVHQGVQVVADASGLTAIAADGTDPGVHEAFWFAWSQFHPDTQLWQPDG